MKETIILLTCSVFSLKKEKKLNMFERLIFLRFESHCYPLLKCPLYALSPSPAALVQPVPWRDPSCLPNSPHPVLHPLGLVCTFLPPLWHFLLLLPGTFALSFAHSLSLSSDQPSRGGCLYIPSGLRFSLPVLLLGTCCSSKCLCAHLPAGEMGEAMAVPLPDTCSQCLSHSSHRG